MTYAPLPMLMTKMLVPAAVRHCLLPSPPAPHLPGHHIRSPDYGAGSRVCARGDDHYV
jgi:hypothetical protein